MNVYQDARLVAENEQTTAGETTAIVSGLRDHLGRFKAFWVARRQRARDTAALEAFTDRELWDLGLSRSDLPRLTDGTFRRDGT